MVPCVGHFALNRVKACFDLNGHINSQNSGIYSTEKLLEMHKNSLNSLKSVFSVQSLDKKILLFNLLAPELFF